MMILSRTRRVLCLGAAFSSLLVLSGCGLQPITGSGGPTTEAIGDVHGKAMGGNTPIVGATATLYATAVNSSISNGTYVGTATPLGTATTDAEGFFTFGTVTSCASNSLVYVTLSGGNTGGGANTNELLGSVYGVCGTVNSSSFVVINEASTVAMAYAFSSFTSIDGSGNVNITAPAANSSVVSNVVGSGTVTTASGLSHAYANFLNLVNPVAGSALAVPLSDVTSQSHDAALAHAIAPQAVVNSLANILQACVNSTGGVATDTSTNCGKVFADTPALGGTAPTNTFQAALNLARNPWVSNANVTALFGLITGIGSGVYSPTLTSAPNDWTLAIQYPLPRNPYSGVTAFPFTVALDADDNVYVTSPEDDPWAANSTTFTTGDSLSACFYGWTSNGAFRPNITDYSGTAGTPGVSGTGTAGSSSWYCSSNASGVTGGTTTAQDLLLTYIAADNVGNVWAHNYGTPGVAGSNSTGLNHVLRLTTAGALGDEEVPPVQTGTATVSYYNSTIAIDKLNNVFFPAMESAAGQPGIIAIAAGATTAPFTALAVSANTGAPQPPAALRGIAFDSIGDLDGSAYGVASGTNLTIKTGGVAFFMPIEGAQVSSGTALYNCSTAGVAAPGVNNSGCSTGNRATKAVGGGSATSSTGDNGPYGVAVDSSNNPWVTAAGPQTNAVTTGIVGLFKCTMTFTTGFISNQACASATSTPATAPKFLEADGNNVLWVMDTTGILAYSSTASPVAATLSETGGFKPCIVQSATTVCTSPDFTASAKGIAVDSTGSVWFTTPDLNGATNSNSLVQVIGTASATWPLLAVQKPGTMPQ